MSEDATGKPPEYREFSLFFEPPNSKMDVNYMRDVRKDVWDISKLELPIYFYQPDVEPSPEGGRVKVVQPEQKKRKKRVLVQADRDDAKPEQQPWVLCSKDGKKYVATPDTLTDRAVMYQQDRGFTLQFVSNSLRVTEEHRSGIQDVDAARSRQRKEEEELESQRRSIGVDKMINKAIEEEIARRKEEAKRVKMELDAGSDQEQGDKSGDDGGVNGVDVETDDGVDKEENSDSEPIDLSLSSSDGEVSDDYSSEEEEKKEDPGKKTPKNSGETAESVIKRIYEDQVKEEELLYYMREMGLVSEQELIKKFRDRLKTHTQKEAFKKLFKRRLQYHTVGDGTRMIKLKSKTQ